MLDDATRKHNLRAAEMVADRARGIASGFSRRIPAATSAQSEPFGASVTTDGRMAPNAAPFEFGEHHPLYGHKPYFKQPHRPYMQAAVESLGDDIFREMAQCVDDWAVDYGFKPE